MTNAMAGNVVVAHTTLDKPNVVRGEWESTFQNQSKYSALRPLLGSFMYVVYNIAFATGIEWYSLQIKINCDVLQNAMALPRTTAHVPRGLPPPAAINAVYSCSTTC